MANATLKKVRCHYCGTVIKDKYHRVDGIYPCCQGCWQCLIERDITVVKTIAAAEARALNFIADKAHAVQLPESAV